VKQSPSGIYQKEKTNEQTESKQKYLKVLFHNRLRYSLKVEMSDKNFS
jgi:hypothetical protein